MSKDRSERLTDPSRLDSGVDDRVKDDEERAECDANKDPNGPGVRIEAVVQVGCKDDR